MIFLLFNLKYNRENKKQFIKIQHPRYGCVGHISL